ncbi:MAG: serine hydrolase domain-containing protein [Alphaproteobacteria bacterium]|nr:serine hydrolase domain-containing protein [Alphaproteobacteria bacterium]
MTSVSIKTKAGLVEGTCDPKFSGVLDAFVTNFEARGEVGASCAVNLGGKTLIDLWGGKKAPGGDPWGRDTVSVIFSSTKGAMALCAHMLADRGKLDLDAPITKYWPEFGQNGKEGATVSMTLDHSVGVPHVRAVPKAGAFYDYDHMVDLVAKEAPFWVPGTRNGYHAVTMSWTVGELVHRAAKKRMGQFFQDEVAKPLGLEFWIGLPEQQEHRIAPMLQAMPTPEMMESRFFKRAMSDPSSASHCFARDFTAFNPNTREGRAAEIGAGNGVTNARNLAGMYAALANGGTLNGVRFVGADTLARMGRVSMATHEDGTLMIPTRFALGYMKSMDNRYLPGTDAASCLVSDAAFGHVGAGGSFGFADPEAKLSFGYTMNQMGLGLLLNDRGQSLVDETYKALGYRSNASGVWAA